MSRMHLNQIQSQLKTAIQNHQILVSRIQLQPKDMAIKAQLYNLQQEIMSMSHRQKLIVEKLRKEIVERKPSDLQEVQPQNLANDTKPEGPPGKRRCQSHNSLSSQVKPIRHSTSSSNTCVQSTSSQRTHEDASSEKVLTSATPAVKTSSSPLRIPSYPSQKTYQTEKIDDSKRDQSTPTKLSPLSPKQKSTSSNAVHSDPNDSEKEMKKKLTFMASIDLVPPDTIKEQTGKRSERKKRSTNNPNFAYGFELERRPRNFLASEYFGAKKPKGQPKTTQCSPPSSSVTNNNTDTSSSMKKISSSSSSICDNANNCKENTLDGSLCRECGSGGELIQCAMCRGGYHAQCVQPTLTSVPDGTWTCFKCQEQSRKSAMSLEAVNMYIATKTGKEEEKRKLLKKSSELLQEKTHLQNRTKQLNEVLARQSLRKQELLEISNKAKESEEKLKSFLKVVQSS